VPDLRRAVAPLDLVCGGERMSAASEQAQSRVTATQDAADEAAHRRMTSFDLTPNAAAANGLRPSERRAIAYARAAISAAQYRGVYWTLFDAIRAADGVLAEAEALDDLFAQVRWDAEDAPDCGCGYEHGTSSCEDDHFAPSDDDCPDCHGEGSEMPRGCGNCGQRIDDAEGDA